MEEPDLLSFFESRYKAGAELAGAGPGSGRKRQSQSSRIRSQCHILQLVTRVLTTGHEHVAIPNTKVLSDSVTNYSTHGLNKGVAVSVVATIGYDVDWRRVHKLLLGEPRTEEIAADPAPRVLEQFFGNYSVEYHLRAWTRTSEGIFESYAALRRNVLDAFADGGVEIMTPTILSHRDASELAVPIE